MKLHALKTPIVIFIYALLMTCSEMAYRAAFAFPNLEKWGETLAMYALFLALFVFAKKRTMRWLIGGFVAWSLLANNVHYAIYHSWITGMNYYLLFAEIREVMTAGQGMFVQIVPHIIWSIAESILFFSILHFKINHKSHPIADWFFVLAILFICVRSFDTPHKQGISPDSGYGRVKAHYFSFGYFIGKILPNQWFNLSKVPQYISTEPQIINQPKIRNIILIMGESESATHIQHFGYPRETSPFFNELAKTHPESIIKPIYSAGKMTFVSLPMFFNMIERPNGLLQIQKGTSNLFRLAQQQGFQTAFHSAQPETEMELINLIGGKWLHYSSYPTELGYAKTVGMNDFLLLPYLKKYPLNQKQHFIVLHQRGSHAPYAHYLSPEEMFFKNNTNLDKYDSSIRHTNLFIKQVFEHLKQQKEQDWLLIYTSDHGQYVTETIANQGTNEDAQYRVPLLIYSPNADVQSQARQLFDACGHHFHYQLALFMAHTMGYDTKLPENCVSGVVTNNALSGDIGWLEIDEHNQKKEVLPQ
ncbi:MAG: sulfatase-like hydrolase/transferase [Alysiella sp.]|uniref:phosphoethanolamine transferase n=1 Tax=Alysiella sp. TaxID=1872483 RepID=UPI0026DB6BCC|nr:sulfatase-like hydrolase/transferase [Alysiella sp.]MDO4433188.1 sulfatase-like hydrolase/transferase [Alysiella sp.]